MDNERTGPVVVGVTGAGHETAALRFAAEVARREGAEVVLAHAFHQTAAGPPPSVLLSHEGAHAVAQVVTAEVAEEFKQLTDGTVGFRTVVVGGAAGRVLVDLSQGARMVVVQHRRDRGLGRVFVGSTAYAAAAHAECPVVSVNPEWQPGASGEVVVGVHEGGGPPEVLELAMAWAAAVGTSLRVVHAWRMDAAYEDVIPASDTAAWREAEKLAIAEAVDGLRGRFPDMQVDLDVRRQSPTDVLVDDSQVASLVVVGRHASHPWALERLGSLARTLLREAKSPVMVVPVSRK
jgi:nucleotide-binding universal stress UspA family protein